MSRTSQTDTADADVPVRRPWGEGPARPVLSLVRDIVRDEVINRHRHDFAQLLYASSGLMRVQTPVGAWTVPPHRAVWIPPNMVHQVFCVGAVAMRNIYVAPDAAADMPGDCRVIAVTGLLRELILAAVALPRDYRLEGAEGRLVSVLLDQIASAPAAGLHLPMPEDRRLRVVTDGLIADPADERPLAAWAREAGASARTLARLFQAETGLSFRAWRQQLRLHEALSRLAAGEPVTSVAYAVGYDSPSAFIAMFRRAMGATPSRYLAPEAAGGEA